jgi:hypothetical protein
MLDEFVAERLGCFISIGFFSVAQVPHLLEQREKKWYLLSHHHTSQRLRMLITITTPCATNLAILTLFFHGMRRPSPIVRQCSISP